MVSLREHMCRWQRRWRSLHVGLAQWALQEPLCPSPRGVYTRVPCSGPCPEHRSKLRCAAYPEEVSGRQGAQLAVSFSGTTLAWRQESRVNGFHI